MPWIEDKNGEKKYKVSLYAKEELPTWGEVYEWLKEPGCLIYNQPNDGEQQDIDPYWKIPSLKCRMVTICNQFNKMLFEDGMWQEVINELNTDKELCKSGTVTDIRFILESISLECMGIMKDHPHDIGVYNKQMTEMYNRIHAGDPNTPPPIYTIPLPTGEKNIFITNDFPRVNINELNEYPLMITPVIKIVLDNIGGKDVGHVYSPDMRMSVLYNTPYPSNYTSSLYGRIIAFMRKPFRDYFENGVGWKDKDGNLIESDNRTPLCQGAGYDPAL